MAKTSRIKQNWFYGYHVKHGINIHIWFHMVCILCHILMYFIHIIYCIVIQRLVDFPLMSVKQCLKPSPRHHHFYRWYVYHVPAMGGLWPCFSQRRHLRPDGKMQISCSCDEDATPHVGWVGVGWGTDNVPVDATQLTALRSKRRGQGTQHVMKMLRHMWVGWGWGGALITFLLMLRNSQLYAATAGDKVCNM